MLVPVDREDEGSVVQHALHMADSLQCQMHLLYNMPAAQREEERQIIDYTKRHEVDLILLVKRKRTGHSLFRTGADVDRLVDQTLCPVLTVSDLSDLYRLKNIVLPVGDNLPMRKLVFAAYLGRTVNSTIHLVAAADSNDTVMGSGIHDNLQKCYRLLRENTNLSIECQSSPVENLAEAAWDYAKKIKADLILTSPGRESVLSGFWSNLRSRLFRRHAARSLPNTSHIPVMTISNQQESQGQH
jgi:hypothetical protein